MVLSRKIPKELREYCDSSISIHLQEPEIGALTRILNGFGINKKLRRVLDESHLVVAGVGSKNPRRVLAVFHPSAHFLMVLEAKGDAPLTVLKPKKNLFFVTALPALIKTVEKPNSNVEKKYSKKFINLALKQHNLALSCLEKGLQSEMGVIKLVPARELVDAAEGLSKRNVLELLTNKGIFKELEKNLSHYLKLGRAAGKRYGSKRVLIEPKQIVLS
jgi:hypothetical protein